MIAWLPLALQVLGWLLKWYGASEETIQKYMELIESTKNDGSISEGTKDKLTSQRESILARVRAREKAKESEPPKEPNA